MAIDGIFEKAKILSEALPYIRRFSGKTFVIKYGGHAMVNQALKESFAGDVALLKFVGINPVIVHGGGPQIGENLKKMGIKSEFKNGLRVTDDQTMEVVEMVLAGKVNKEIVTHVNSMGGRAVGLSGIDGRMILAEKQYLEMDQGEELPPEIIDIGRVGKVVAINPEVIEALMREKFIPIIAPVGVGEQGEAYNINADTVAAEVAIALKAEKLILLTDIDGVKGKTGELIPSLQRDEADALIKSGVIIGGMLPKVKSCLRALEMGVGKAHIIDGRKDHALLLEIFTDSGVGTVMD